MSCLVASGALCGVFKAVHGNFDARARDLQPDDTRTALWAVMSRWIHPLNGSSSLKSAPYDVIFDNKQKKKKEIGKKWKEGGWDPGVLLWVLSESHLYHSWAGIGCCEEEKRVNRVGRSRKQALDGACQGPAP
jgi:hypothetical protein